MVYYKTGLVCVTRRIISLVFYFLQQGAKLVFLQVHGCKEYKAKLLRKRQDLQCNQNKKYYSQVKEKRKRLKTKSL